MVVGIVLGAWQPRGELLSLRAELDQLRAHGGKPCRGGAAESIRSILRADAPDLSLDEEPADEAPNVDGVATETPAEAPTDGEAPAEGPTDAPQTPEEMQEGLRAALDARRAQALAALVEQGGLEEEEVDAVNAAMDQMNRELKAEVDAFVTDAASTGEVDRRDVMDFAAEALDIVIAADDRMRHALPADVYAQVDDSAVDPFSYVSGDTLDALARLEGVPVLEGR